MFFYGNSRNVTQDITIPNVTASGGFPTCTHTSGTINASSTTSGVLYNWTGPGIVSGANSPSALVNAPGTYVITVTNPFNMCTKTDTVIVNSDNSIPNITTGPSLTLNCLVLGGTITANSTTPGINYSSS